MVQAFIAAALLIAVPAPALFAQSAPQDVQPSATRAAQPDQLDPAQFKWKTRPEVLRAALESSVRSEQIGGYTQLTRAVNVDAQPWQQFFIFYHDELIAQGFTRQEKLVKPRVGSISDVVSYDNNHRAASVLTQKFGAPTFKDVRTRDQFSQEMGDDALRARRSLEWDLHGERYRWELTNGTVRYTVQYSMDGLADHRIVNVNPGNWAHYFEFITTQAFREAGVDRVRSFRRKARTWLTAQFSQNGELQVTKHAGRGASRPRSARRTQSSSDHCRMAEQRCSITYYYYGDLLYQVDVDFSRQGSFPRRERHDKIGKAFYEHFAAINTGLQRQLGTPQDTRIIKDMDNGRDARKAADLVRGQQGFWSVWYDAPSDTLVRHVITGESRDGTSYAVDHKITYRFHSVARALAEQDAWQAEAADIASR